MAEYVTVPAANCFSLPAMLTFEQGAMMEPLGCCLHGIAQLDIKPGASAVVIGGGYIGLLMVQLLHLYGASPIVVSELDKSKHAIAVELGATCAYSPVDTDLMSVREEQASGGFDIVIECVGRAETMQTAIHMAGKGGQILLFGVADPSTDITVNPFEIFSKELQIKGSFINPHTHNAAIALVQQGKVDVTRTISHRFSLEELPDAMASYPSLRVTKGILHLT
ncbi:zinc-binding dehydrogenase [Alicyclobacillus fastidiosus]|nr:zinc-binding dehydrogenase [Alicyclobacillus fastidiosus]GMA65039.1 hypothetical protein GCM10025859_54790 [Alicyclobacillus fastidiosus]